eukprot:6235210-Prymnesium_polylepis.1
MRQRRSSVSASNRSSRGDGAPRVSSWCSAWQLAASPRSPWSHRSAPRTSKRSSGTSPVRLRLSVAVLTSGEAASSLDALAMAGTPGSSVSSSQLSSSSTALRACSSHALRTATAWS